MKADKIPTVLIVEDEPYLNRAIQDIFEDNNITGYSSIKGKEGLEILETIWIDVCIVDMRLPDMTGNEFIAKANSRYPHMKYIIYTGTVGYSIPQDLKAIGVKKKHIFNKPVKNLEELVEAVVKVHNQKQEI